MRSRIDTLSIIGVLKNNREKENNLVATSSAERGIARHFPMDRLEAYPTTLLTLRSLLVMGTKLLRTTTFIICGNAARQEY